MKKQLSKIIPCFFLLLIISCGGGGVGGDGGGNNNPPSQPTTAVLKLLASGTLPASTTIGGIQVTVLLPAGVTVKSTANPPETDANVVVQSGNALTNSTILSTYDPTSQKVTVFLVNPNGFNIGEYATMNCNIAAGYHPTQADFSLTGTIVKDLNGASVSGITAGFTAAIQ